MNQKASNNNNYKCWNFSEQEEVSYPILIINIRNSATKKNLEIITKVDTGFNGVIGLTKEQIEELKLESEGATVIRTASGRKAMKFYKIEFEIPGTEFEELRGIGIETPRAILGRTVLNLANWLYDGKNKQWCLL